MKLKDFVTLGNLLAGFAAVVMLIEGEYDWACYLIFIGYAFDALDGPVARLTKQHDEFGGVFDTLCDFVTSSIAPSFIIYYAFTRTAGWPPVLAAVLGALPITFGTIRQARYQLKDMSYPCYWLGLPRPVLTMFVIALLRSSIFEYDYPAPWGHVLYSVAALLIAGGSVLHLSHFPFINHHGRRFSGLVRYSTWWFFLSSVAAWAVGYFWLDAPWFLFDMLAYNFIAYVFISWTQIPRDDWRRIRRFVATGEKTLPLCHRDGEWRAGRIAPILDPPHDPA